METNQKGGEESEGHHAAGCHLELVAVGGAREGQVAGNKPWRSCLMSWAASSPSHTASTPSP